MSFIDKLLIHDNFKRDRVIISVEALITEFKDTNI